VNELQRAQVLTNELLTFSKGGESKKATVSVGDVIGGSKRLASSGAALDCVIHSIIRRHGGSIFIEPRVRQGTTAVVYLPATREPPRSEARRASA